MQKIKSVHKYFLASFFVVMVVNSSSLVLASPTDSQSLQNISPIAWGPDIGSVATEYLKGVASPLLVYKDVVGVLVPGALSLLTPISEHPSVRRARQAEAFTEWMKVACFNSRNLEDCQEQKIKDVMALNYNISVAIAKKQEICNELVLNSVRKTECIDAADKIITRDSQAYLSTQPESFTKNKEYIEESDKIKKKEQADIKKCEHAYNTSYVQRIADNSVALEKKNNCVKNAKEEADFSKCVAKKMLKETGKGSKYDPAKFNGSSSRAKDAIKKDCKEKNKKSKTTGTISS